MTMKDFFRLDHFGGKTSFLEKNFVVGWFGRRVWARDFKLGEMITHSWDPRLQTKINSWVIFVKIKACFEILTLPFLKHCIRSFWGRTSYFVRKNLLTGYFTKGNELELFREEYLIYQNNKPIRGLLTNKIFSDHFWERIIFLFNKLLMRDWAIVFKYRGMIKYFQGSKWLRKNYGYGQTRPLDWEEYSDNFKNSFYVFFYRKMV